MVKKKDSADKLKVNPLQVEKETVQDLDADEMQQVEGGIGLPGTGNCASLRFTCDGRTCGKKRPECLSSLVCDG